MSERIKVYDDPGALMRDLAAGDLRGRIRDPLDMPSYDGNVYTLIGHTSGEIILRSHVRRLEDAVSELQDLLSDCAAVLKRHGLLDTPADEAA